MGRIGGRGTMEVLEGEKERREIMYLYFDFKNY